jgi:hypothetical protein
MSDRQLRRAVKVLARLAAKKAVGAELRAKGVRVTLVRPAEIGAQANAYLAANPQLYDEDRERAQRMGMFEKRQIEICSNELAIAIPPTYRLWSEAVHDCISCAASLYL